MTPKIETRLVADLIPYASNSRTHSDAQIAQKAIHAETGEPFDGSR